MRRKKKGIVNPPPIRRLTKRQFDCQEQKEHDLTSLNSLTLRSGDGGGGYLINYSFFVHLICRSKLVPPPTFFLFQNNEIPIGNNQAFIIMLPF